ncbi:MAG: S4 domain-containing protein [Patescibacteria group bacterium]
MSLPDETIAQVFESCTNIPLVQIPHDGHPMENKKKLAWQIVFQYNNKEAADAAQKHFESTVQAGEVPQDIPTISVKSTNIVDVLVETKLASSKSEAKRLIEQKGVRVNDQVISNFEFQISNSCVINIGRRFIKIIYG